MELVLTQSEKSLLTTQEILLFTRADPPEWWDGECKESTIKGKTDWRKLTHPLPCGAGCIEVDFKWNGASSGIFRRLIILNFPKWKHPIATCRHDKRCEIAERFKNGHYSLYRKLRKFADVEFPKDVAIGGTWWETKKGYIAVRAGAMM